MDFKTFMETSKVTQLVYHGTSANFRKFNLKKSTQGIIWFSSNKAAVEAREVGAQGHGYILELEVDIKNPAGWDEYENLLLSQLKSIGYDGAILPDKDGHFDGFVFNPNQIKIIRRLKPKP